MVLSGSSYATQQQILDPAVHNLTRLDTLELGKETDSSHMAPKEYRLKVGQGYRWKIQAAPGAEYALVAPAFFRNIWIRKVEAGEVEIKSATLDELEFENGGEAELFFVAIRPGTYDFGPKGMMERGIVGKSRSRRRQLGAIHVGRPASWRGAAGVTSATLSLRTHKTHVRQNGGLPARTGGDAAYLLSSVAGPSSGLAPTFAPSLAPMLSSWKSTPRKAARSPS
jgi:uncharacterized cupredoxin-like copper-binding protein